MAEGAPSRGAGGFRASTAAGLGVEPTGQVLGEPVFTIRLQIGQVD